MACTQRETIRLAAQKGIGALSFGFVEPGEAEQWVGEYYATLASDECVPAGFAVNANVACVLPFMCHEDEQEAIDRGLDGAHFFGYSLGHFYGFGDHRPGVTDIHAEFLANRSAYGFDRETAAQVGVGLRTRMTREADGVEEGFASLRGAIGTPDQIRDLLRDYEAAGVDQVIFVSQAGRNRHEHICESMELFAREVMGEFAERGPAHVAARVPGRSRLYGASKTMTRLPVARRASTLWGPSSTYRSAPTSGLSPMKQMSR